MPKVLVAIADGTEELEAVTIIDILRRAEIEVSVASVMEDRKITASRGVEITADCHIQYCQDKHWDMVVLPGGMPGSEHLAKSKALLDILNDQHKAERWISAICAAPAVVLGAHGFLKGASATCYPAFRNQLDEYHCHDVSDKVAVHKHFITSQGPGTAMAFSLELVAVLEGEVLAQKIARELCFDGRL